jgi:hypothetical protein
VTYTPPPPRPKTTIDSDGTYQVGVDIMPGTYRSVAHHAAVRGRRGRFKAIGATRHDLLIAYGHVVHDEVNYANLAPTGRRGGTARSTSSTG